eukprot:14279944-Alexandrium_andersonii.AAC.1
MGSAGARPDSLRPLVQPVLNGNFETEVTYLENPGPGALAGCAPPPPIWAEVPPEQDGDLRAAGLPAPSS